MKQHLAIRELLPSQIWPLEDRLRSTPSPDLASFSWTIFARLDLPSPLPEDFVLATMTALIESDCNLHSLYSINPDGAGVAECVLDVSRFISFTANRQPLIRDKFLTTGSVLLGSPNIHFSIEGQDGQARSVLLSGTHVLLDDVALRALSLRVLNALDSQQINRQTSDQKIDQLSDYAELFAAQTSSNAAWASHLDQTANLHATQTRPVHRWCGHYGAPPTNTLERSAVTFRSDLIDSFLAKSLDESAASATAIVINAFARAVRAGNEPVIVYVVNALRRSPVRRRFLANLSCALPIMVLPDHNPSDTLNEMSFARSLGDLSSATIDAAYGRFARTDGRLARRQYFLNAFDEHSTITDDKLPRNSLKYDTVVESRRVDDFDPALVVEVHALPGQQFLFRVESSVCLFSRDELAILAGRFRQVLEGQLDIPDSPRPCNEPLTEMALGLEFYGGRVEVKVVGDEVQVHLCAHLSDVSLYQRKIWIQQTFVYTGRLSSHYGLVLIADIPCSGDCSELRQVPLETMSLPEHFSDFAGLAPAGLYGEGASLDTIICAYLSQKGQPAQTLRAASLKALWIDV